MMPELQRTRYITQNYNSLRGLAIAAVGFGFFLFGAWSLWSQHVLSTHSTSLWHNTIIQVILFCLLMGSVCGLIRITTRYYDRTFGKVEARDNKTERVQTVWVLLISAGTLSAGLDISLHLPISIMGLTIASCFFIRWWLLERVPTHYLVVALLVALISIFPSIDPALYQQLLAYNTKNSFGAYEAIAYMLIGPLMAICGVLDHRMLVRILAPDAREPVEETKWERS